MKIETHKKRSLAEFGVEAEDIHEWIDGFFDHSRFNAFLRTGVRVDGFDPYDHRIHRHCKDAEDECVETFLKHYSEKVIRGIFEQHIRDDYDGYYPDRTDFDRDDFHEKYHNR